MNRAAVAVITGASAGVGRATALAFAGAGYDVALLARGTAGLEAAAKEIAGSGHRVLTLRVDVADWEQVDHAATTIEAELGPIAVWVNNAMTTVFTPTQQVEPAAFRRATEVTYLGQVHGTLAALRRMQARDEGTIVNVGSALSFVGIPLQAAYCGAKFACRGFFESVRAELLHQGSRVRISMVHLPAVNTPQFEWCENALPQEPQPVPPIYQPEITARAILRSAQDGKSRVVGVWNRFVIGGHNLFPELTARFAARTGVKSQQTDRPADPDRPSNLYQPVDADDDFGAHGPFNDRAGGMGDASFVRSFPRLLADIGASLMDLVRARSRVGR